MKSRRFIVKKYRVAHALLLNDNNYLLLQLRDNCKDIIFPNHWSLFGGSIEYNENPYDAIEREIYEELNLKLTQYKFICEKNVIYQNNMYYIYIFSSIINYKKKDLILNEGSDLDYFSINEISSLKMSYILKHLVLEILT
jgi:8-oxo-dGTP diphosphatase